MSKDPSPLLGYNNNIRHKDRVFHVQTEDSGVRHPHIITHLFMDGGRILKSVKTSYAEHLGIEKMADVVQGMMKKQHKTMLLALREGQFDQLVEGGSVPAARAPASAPEVLAPPSPPAPKAAPEVKARPPSMRPPPRASVPEEDAPVTARNSGPPEELTLDIDALERAAAESSSPLFMQSDLPPPPANLFRERGGGAYSTVTPPSIEKIRPSTGKPPPLPAGAHGVKSQPPGRYARSPPSRPPAQAPRRGGTPRPPPPSTKASGKPAGRPRSVPPGPISEGRARPPASFGANRPSRGNSIFGEDLISDKSLDEVILSYLAEDLDPASEKKK